MAKSGRKPVPIIEKRFRDKMGCLFCDYYEDRGCMFERLEYKCPFREDLKGCEKYTTYIKVGLDDAAKIGQETTKLRKAGIING